MGTVEKDVKRVVSKTAAQLEAGGIILDQFGLASDTKQVIARDSSGYYRSMCISKPNTISAINTFSAAQTFNNDVNINFGTTTRASVLFDSANGDFKISCAGLAGIVLSPGGSFSLILAGTRTGTAVRPDIEMFKGATNETTLKLTGKSNTYTHTLSIKPNSSTDVAGESVISGTGSIHFSAAHIRVDANKAFKTSIGSIYDDGSTLYMLHTTAAGQIIIGNQGGPTTATTVIKPGGVAVMSIAHSGTSATGGTITLIDGAVFSLGTSFGASFGSNSSQKAGFNGYATAHSSPTGVTTGFTAGSGTAVNDDSTFDGNTGSEVYTLGDLIFALKQKGVIKT